MAKTASPVAVVTGAASGIGRQLALQAASRGARVAVVDIEADRAAETVELIRRSGAEARAYGCDVANADDMLALANSVAADIGDANWVFNNAGVIAGGTVEKTRITDAQWMFNVNVLGVLNGVQAFLPHLYRAVEAGGPAHIVNTGSENSVGVPLLGPTSVYTATKHAVLGLTDCIRRDLEGTGIKVTLLCPGLVQTDIFDARRNRPEALGGAVRLPQDRAEAVRGMMKKDGQDPALTARLCFEAMDRGDFMLITDPKVRGFAEKRHREVGSALDRIDARLAQDDT